jgi:hypothetical protein
MNKVNEWKADLEACLAPVVAAAAAEAVTAVSSPASNRVACPPQPLPSSAAVEALEARYKELECIVPDHKRIEPLLRDYKRWRERHKPWSEFFLWCRAAKAGCFLSGDGYDPSPPLATLSNANLSIPIKRVKSDDVMLPVSSKTTSDRRRRSVSDAPPPSPPVAGKKTGRDSAKKVEEEESDHTLYCCCATFVAGFVL